MPTIGNGLFFDVSPGPVGARDFDVTPRSERLSAAFGANLFREVFLLIDGSASSAPRGALQTGRLRCRQIQAKSILIPPPEGQVTLTGKCFPTGDYELPSVIPS